jgi:cytoskeletal protein CcmA (bactofilin family)
MKKIFALTFLAALLVAPISSQAKSQIIKTSEGENKGWALVGDSLFVAGEDIHTQTSSEGDLFAAGWKVLIDSDVSEDLFVAGRTVEVRGEIADDARIAGQFVTISGKIAETTTVTGQEIVITENAEIGGDLIISGGKVDIRGTIKGNLVAGTGTLNFTGSVEKDAEISTGELNTFSEGQIAGDLRLKAPLKTGIAQNQVAGNLEFEQDTSLQSWEGFNFDLETIKWGATLVVGFLLLIKFLSGLIMALLIIGFLRRWLLNFTEESENQIWSNLGWGTLVLITAPILGSIFIGLIFLAPLGKIIFTSLGLLTIFANLVSGFFVGNLILPIDKKSSFGRILGSYLLGELVINALVLLAIFIGVLIIGKASLAALWIVPAFCLFGLLAIYLITVGALIHSEIDLFKFLRRKKQI